MISQQLASSGGIWAYYNQCVPRHVISPAQCVCLTNSVWRPTSNPKCHLTLLKTKANANWHIHFLLKEMSLQCHLSSSTCHLNFSITNQRLIFFPPVTPHVNWRTFFLLCASFCISNVKKLWFFSKVHTTSAMSGEDFGHKSIEILT